MLITLMILTSGFVKSQSNLVVDTTLTAEQLIKNVLLQGDNIKVGNIKYNGHPSAVGYFNIDEERSFKLKNGIILSTGNVNSSVGPNTSPSLSDTLGRGGDKDLLKLGKRKTYDAAVLEFDFVPFNNKVSFTYIFASEEYLEYSGSKYNDVFAFFISGPGIEGLKNMATLPRTSNEVVSINTINQFKNQDYFINNNYWRIDGKAKSEYELSTLDKELLQDIEYDGMTVALKAETNVIPYKKYHFKIAIADVSDMRYNSAVFLKGGSFTTEIDTTATGIFSFVENVDTNKVDFEAIFENKAFDIADAQVKAVAIPKDIPNEYGTEVFSSKSVTPIKEKPAYDKVPSNHSKNIILTLPAKFESVLFDYNSDVLSKNAKASLNILVEMLNATPSAQTHLIGHTDATGSNQYNISLSKSRVEAVYDYLKSQGVDTSRLKTEYFGESKPKASNQSQEGRAINRRVDIILEKA